MSQVVKIETEVTVFKFLDKVVGLDDGPLTMVLDLFGGRTKIIDVLVEYFLGEPDNLKDKQQKETFKQILFSCSGNDTYAEDWEQLWDKLKDLPVGFLVESLEENPPGKNSGKCTDVALNYILWKKYDVSSTDDITKEIYEELKDLFYSEPEDFKKFRLRQHFIDEVLEFNDPRWIYETYSEFSFDKEEILEILKQVVTGRKLDTIEKVGIFLGMVRYYAPQNIFDKKYRDQFVLEIFEADDGSGVGMWSEDVEALWKEEFYDIDFDDCSEAIKDRISDSCKAEAKHISEQLKINPLYRHD